MRALTSAAALVLVSQPSAARLTNEHTCIKAKKDLPGNLACSVPETDKQRTHTKEVAAVLVLDYLV